MDNEIGEIILGLIILAPLAIGIFGAVAVQLAVAFVGAFAFMVPPPSGLSDERKSIKITERDYDYDEDY